ncbi:MAG: paraquat-inducible protein A [Myxococcota bacterium]
MNGCSTAPQSAIECAYCGLLQGRPELAPGQSAHCAGCDAKLFQDKPRGVERALALTVAALVLLAIANLTDFMTFEFRGRFQHNRIITGVLELSRLGYAPLGALILFTSVVAPLLHLSGMLCVLASVQLGRSPSWLGPLFRRLEFLRPWSMLEVYLLGVLVAVFKLNQMASIELATAFWAYLALIAVMTAAYDSLDSRSVWENVRLTGPEDTP